MKVICVDDEPLIVESLMSECSSISFVDEILGFTQSLEALEYAKANSFDAALLDIDMPNLNGLELAREIKKLHPKTAVIYTTALSQYAVEAFKTRASGYLMKPIERDDIEAELRYAFFGNDSPVQGTEKNRIFARAFGSFEIFVDDVPVSFGRKYSKELLAILIDRRGSSLTRKEIAAILFEDSDYNRSTQSYLSHIIDDLRKSLKNVGADMILKHSTDSYSIDPSAFSCDCYDYLEGKENTNHLFNGEYMSQYSWAEMSLGLYSSNVKN